MDSGSDSDSNSNSNSVVFLKFMQCRPSLSTHDDDHSKINHLHFFHKKTIYFHACFRFVFETTEKK